MKKSRRITLQAILLSLTLIIYVIESALPPLLPGVSGVRLGLSNVFILYTLCVLGISPAVWLMIAKCILGPIFAGAPTAIFYSLAGGILSLMTMIVMKKIFCDKIGLVGISVTGAIMHNVGQLLMAALLTSTGAIFIYLPTMTAMSILTGIVTGLLTGAIIRITRRIWNPPNEEAKFEKH